MPWSEQALCRSLGGLFSVPFSSHGSHSTPIALKMATVVYRPQVNLSSWNSILPKTTQNHPLTVLEARSLTWVSVGTIKIQLSLDPSGHSRGNLFFCLFPFLGSREGALHGEGWLHAFPLSNFKPPDSTFLLWQPPTILVQTLGYGREARLGDTTYDMSLSETGQSWERYEMIGVISHWRQAHRWHSWDLARWNTAQTDAICVWRGNKAERQT